MRVFGIDIFGSKASSNGKGQGQLERPAQGQGPFTSLFENWIARQMQPSLYEALRESIPVVDTAIGKYVTLDGIIQIEGDNKGLVHEIEDWMHEVRVNDLEIGLQAFVNNQSNETYEQGFSICEFVPNADRTDIVRLNVADSKDIRFRRGDKGLEIWYKGRSGNKKNKDLSNQVGDILAGSFASETAQNLTANGWSQLKGDNLIYASIGNENHNPYGTSLIRSTEFAAKILLTIENATLNVWERFGDPIYQVTYKAGKREIGIDSLETRRKAIADAFNAAITAKRIGKSADFVQAVDQNSDMVIKVIGADNQLLQMEVPARHVLEQIVARSGLPPWMFGYHWSTTERVSVQQVEMVLHDAEIRSDNKKPNYERLISTLLKMRGRKWKRDDWLIVFKRPSLHDLVAQAQARFLNAQADMYYMNGGRENQVVGQVSEEGKMKFDIGAGLKSAPTKGCGCGGVKESRPIPHPALDKIEIEYQAALQGKWGELNDRIFAILQLNQLKMVGTAHPTKGPVDPFTYTQEQRAQILDAMKSWIVEWKPSPNDMDNPLRWYYGQAYSLGLIQAAQMIGNERPVLDIIKNREIYQDLVNNGFSLVKDNATTAIVDKLLPEIKAQVIAGTNPLHVANRLEKLFGDANSNWERLARSEMAMSAERAKIDEYKENGIEKMHFYTAPDACPICQALEDDYEIGKVPLPVKDTHPRCYCTLGPVKE